MKSHVVDLILSGSPLLILGFVRGDHLLHDIVPFVEATLGLILVAMSIAYLPTMYGAFSLPGHQTAAPSIVRCPCFASER